MIERIGIPTVIILSVLLFGAVEDWSVAVTGILTLIFFNLWLIIHLKNGRDFSFIHKPLLFSILASVGFGLFQIMPLPVGLLRFLSPAKYSILETLSLQGFNSISVYPYATIHAILKMIIYLILFVLAVSVTTKRENLLNVINVIIFFGFILSIFALIQKATWNGKIYWFRELTMGGSPFGPFVNKNHFAGFIEMIIPFGLALSIQSRENAKKFLYIFSSVIMGFALFYSLSRGGIISFLFSIVLFSSLLIYRKTESKPLIVVSFFILLLLSYLVYFGLSPIIERFASTDLTTQQRFIMWRSLLNTVKDYGIAGTGLGTFGYISAMYHPEGITSFFDHAHNDYLELLIEAGLIGALIFISFGAIVLATILRSKWLKGRDFYIILACLSSIGAIAVHSVVDFNLHITSNAILLSVILGFSYGMAVKRTNRDRLGDC